MGDIFLKEKKYSKGIDYAINIGANILITCDCVIVEFQEITYAK